MAASVGMVGLCLPGFSAARHGGCLDESGKGCQKVCDKIKEMPKGKWIATLAPGLSYDYVGFYVPQFLNGSITREAIDGKRAEASRIHYAVVKYLRAA